MCTVITRSSFITYLPTFIIQCIPSLNFMPPSPTATTRPKLPFYPTSISIAAANLLLCLCTPPLPPIWLSHSSQVSFSVENQIRILPSGAFYRCMWTHLHFQGSALGWPPNPRLVLQFKYHSQATVNGGQGAQGQDVAALCLFLRVSHS